MDRIIRTCSGFLAVALTALATPARADVPVSLIEYARARIADAAGDSRAATARYRAALAATPDNPVIAVRAYREALTAGDMALARTAAATLDKAGVAPPDAVLLAVAAAVRGKQWQATNAAADRLSSGPLDFLGPVIKAWVAFERGADAPGTMLDVNATNALARRFNVENRALLLIAAGKEDAGIAELRALLSAGTDSANLRIAAAQLLAGRGKADAAALLLAGDDPVLAAVRDALDRGVRPSAAFGVSRVFVRLAADLVDGDARPLAILLCRAAIELDPSDDRAKLTLAGALSNDGAQDRAQTLLADISITSPYAATARAMRITLFSRAGDQRRALAAATRAAELRGATADDAQRLGDMLVASGHYDQAAAAYATAMAHGRADDWTLNLQRGGALEQGGRWDEALPFLKRAVELAPKQAHALNYLGYAQVERGENLDAARALLERAAKLEPDDASITDSLGWAYIKSGQTKKALPLLERAARAEPADATINEHLGDAYWALGRRYEARYAWRAAALYADGKDAVRLSDKLTK